MYKHFEKVLVVVIEIMPLGGGALPGGVGSPPPDECKP